MIEILRPVTVKQLSVKVRRKLKYAMDRGLNVNEYSAIDQFHTLANRSFSSQEISGKTSLKDWAFSSDECRNAALAIVQRVSKRNRFDARIEAVALALKFNLPSAPTNAHSKNVRQEWPTPSIVLQAAISKGVAHEECIRLLRKAVKDQCLNVNELHSIVDVACRFKLMPEQAMEVVLALVATPQRKFPTQLSALVSNIRTGTEGYTDALYSIIYSPSGTYVSQHKAIQFLIYKNEALSKKLVSQIIADQITGNELLRWAILVRLRSENRLAEFAELLAASLQKFPNNLRFTIAAKELAKQSEEELFDSAIPDTQEMAATVAHDETFGTHLSLIYGKYMQTHPTVQPSVYDDIFSKSSSDTPHVNAEVLAGLAGVVVEQLGRLNQLYYGRERETSSLYDWGVSCYDSWLERSSIAANAARALLTTALQIDPDCEDAFVQLAKLDSYLRNFEQSVAFWERSLTTSKGKRENDDFYLQALCQIGRESSAASILSELGSTTRTVLPATYVGKEDFSAIRSTETILEAEKVDLWLNAVREIEFRTVLQPVEYDELEIHQMHDVSFIGSSQLVGPASDALRYDSSSLGRNRFSPVLTIGDSGFAYEMSNERECITEPCLALFGKEIMNVSYYHFLVQNVGRLPWLIEKGFVGDRKVLLSSTLPGWARGIVNWMGVPDEQIIYTSADKAYHFSDLVVPTPPRMAGIPNPKVLSTLRNMLDIDRVKAPVGGRKIFWTRSEKGSIGRALTNEHHLRDAAIEHGFEIVDPARLSLKQQADMLRETSVVAGPTGGAFSNLVAAPEGIHAICIAPRASAKNYYPALAGSLNQNFTWVLGEFSRESLHCNDFPQLPYSTKVKSLIAAFEKV